MGGVKQNIADTTDVICRCACQLDVRCDCNRCEVWVDAVYTAHVKPLEDALAKAEADKAALAEALDKTTSTLAIINEGMPGGTYYKKYEPLATDALMKASAALARVKGEA